MSLSQYVIGNMSISYQHFSEIWDFQSGVSKAHLNIRSTISQIACQFSNDSA